MYFKQDRGIVLSFEQVSRDVWLGGVFTHETRLHGYAIVFIIYVLKRLVLQDIKER